MNKTQKIVFGGGCFWCTEAVFKMMKGVISVLPGYSGGTTKNPTYEQVCGGNTGYAESVQIEYDPALVPLRSLLTVFFGSHDPTTRNKQGNDVGTQYRSVIFYTTPAQQEEIEKFIKEINDSNKLGTPIVTEVEPLQKFWLAENYHQDYFAKNKGNPYCEIVINPKLEKVQKEFANLMLTPEQYKVLKEKGTEAPFSGKYVYEKKSGTYNCAVCANPLFSSTAKFDSDTGWPSFDEALPGAVKYEEDNEHGMKRTEIVCSKCGSHLGHVFDDGPTKTGKRYCLNSVCLDLEEGK